MIKIDELISEFERLSKRNIAKGRKGLTKQELMDVTGMNYSKITKFLATLSKEDKLIVEMFSMPTIVPGRTLKVPHYRLKGK